MRKLLFIFLAFFISTAIMAKIAPDENILVNGNLMTDQSDMPIGWTTQGDFDFLVYHSNGGPNDMPYISIDGGESSAFEVSFRQFGIRLVAGEKYKLSGLIRTKNFKSSNAGYVIANAGWNWDAGLKSIPANQDWTLMEQEITTSPSIDGTYFAAIFAVSPAGSIDFADLKLVALTEKGQQETIPLSLDPTNNKIRLVPMSPILYCIPKANPAVNFRLFGGFKKELSEYSLVATFSDTDAKVTQTLVKNDNSITLPASCNEGTLTVAVVDKENSHELYSISYPYCVRDIPEIPATSQKRLNNLVTEVLNTAVDTTADTQEFTFFAPKDGWIFFAAKDMASDSLRIVLDDKLTIIDKDTPRLENFRELLIGKHKLAITGATNGGTMLVHSIVDTFNYCPGANSGVMENPPYDWEFQMKYGMPAITTQNGGNIPEEHRKWFQDQGYRWLANLGSTNLSDDHDLTKRLEASHGFKAPYDGVTCDEQFFSVPAMIEKYTAGLHDFKNPTNGAIYTWIVNSPGTPGTDHAFIAEAINASHGRGKLLCECYCRTKASEDAVEGYLDAYVGSTLRAFKKYYPGSEKSIGIILGNFNQVPIISLQHHPEVDYKYYLDKQLNILANNPNYDGIGCVGYWGSYYADHELHRWSLMLLRHYCVEGKTNMLSEEYGFSYIPGHIQNGDFRKTMEPWSVDGNVTSSQYPGLAATSQNRWGGNGGVGDTFAAFSKKADEISTVSQNITGLVPGKAYLLQFSTFDIDDVKTHVVNPRRFGINATLGDGAIIRHDLSWTHIDKRMNGRYSHNNGVARPNLHHVVFIATKPEITLKLDNALAKSGENLGVNFLSVTPFLLEEE